MKYEKIIGRLSPSKRVTHQSNQKKTIHHTHAHRPLPASLLLSPSFYFFFLREENAPVSGHHISLESFPSTILFPARRTDIPEAAQKKGSLITRKKCVWGSVRGQRDKEKTYHPLWNPNQGPPAAAARESEDCVSLSLFFSPGRSPHRTGQSISLLRPGRRRRRRRWRSDRVKWKRNTKPRCSRATLALAYPASGGWVWVCVCVWLCVSLGVERKSKAEST